MGRRQQSQGQQQGKPPSVILPLPAEVRQVVDNGNRCDNIALWLDRFLTVNPQNWELTQDAKHRKRVMQLAGQSQGYVEALQRRYEAMLEWYKQRGKAQKGCG